MNFFARRRMKSMLADCDFQLAAEMIRQKFEAKDMDVGASYLEEYLANPCFKTAIRLIDSDPLFTYYFTESKPDGLYARLHRKNGKTQPQENSRTKELSPREPASGEVSVDEATALPQERSTFRPTAAAMTDDKESPVTYRIPDQGNLARKMTAASLAEEDHGNGQTRPVTFSNVLATLRHDIEELQKQVRYYEEKLSQSGDGHPDYEKYKRQLEMYRAGVAEFREAVNILRKHGRSR